MKTSRITQAACMAIIALATAAITPPVEAQTTTMHTSTALRLRAGPTTSSRVVAVIPHGTAVSVGTCENGWCESQYEGRNGYTFSRYLIDTGNRAQENAFPQCRGAGPIAPTAPPSSASPYSREYVQSWLRPRRDRGDRVAVPGVEDSGERAGSIREITANYFHFHLGELNGREKHFCLPYAAVRSLEIVETGPGNTAFYRIILFPEWVGS